ncbi:MAG: hypothetical protein ACI9VS_001062 [Candidatus Binatia bacterium]|jgi:hypothetical protein
MIDGKQIDAGHPLLAQLRNGLLWHRTNPAAFRQIREDGFLRPLKGTTSRWGNRPYACQTLGAICLFDFTTEPEKRVLETANRWQQFMGDEQPVTIVMGMEAANLPGRLVRYPETRDGTPSDSGGPIPWVEVCHVGEIPISAVVSYLLVCPVDYTRFKRCAQFDDQTLSDVEREFSEIIRIDEEDHARMIEGLQVHPVASEFEARLEQARRRIEEMGDRQ